MKKLLFLFTMLLGVTFFSSCDNDDDDAVKEPGTMDVTFDNIAIVGGKQTQLTMATPGSADYNYTNEMGQKFNINLLRYYISAIELDGPNGEHYHDHMEVKATESKGYYLVDESNSKSQTVTLSEIPAGEYNKITFTVGVDSAGVVDGASGGVLDPANKMFWSWNSGYIAVKFEGQSDMSNGGASGETVTSDNKKGIVYHVGGWKNIAGSAFVYNNKKITLAFDTNVKIEKGKSPELHLVFDVLSMFKGTKNIDFTGNHNVHKPSDGVDMANNIAKAFAYDHVHQ